MLNCAFSFGRLMFTAGVRIDLMKALILPALCSVIAIWAVSALGHTDMLGSTFSKSALLPVLIAVAVYTVLLKATGAIGQKRTTDGIQRIF